MSLSVIIPAYNRAQLISETLRSLLMQTKPADEIIVVDDGSTDNTIAVSESFGAPVRVIRQTNRGPSAARNAGIRASHGEFIHFFDSDDLAACNKHAVQLAALKASGADIAIGPWVQGWFSQSRFSASNHVLQQRGLPTGNDLVKELLSTWSFVPHSALFRRSIVEKVGGFPEDLFCAEDQFLFLACLLAGARVVHTPETIEFYRLGDSGKITENSDWAMRRMREWGRFLIKARRASLKHGIEPLRWFGYRYRLWEAQQDLNKAEQPDVEWKTTLRDLAPTGTAAAMCRYGRYIGRWRGGLQQRMTGGRAASSFRMGPITPNQISLLHKLGYAYEAPQQLPWLPQRRKSERCAG